MSDDLIDPDAIPVPIVNTVLLESAAGGLRTDGENIAESGQSIKSSWAGLQAVYSAPEAETLYSAVDPVATTGDAVETDFGTAATALETFAERARELRSELVQARQDARDLVAEIRSDDDWDDGGFFGGESDKVEEHNNLLNHVNSLHQQYQEAERECANAITALFGGTTFIASNADGTTQPGAGEAVHGFEEAPEDVGTPWGSPQGTDHMWYVDAIHGGGDVLMGSLEDMGGAVGIHGSEGWFTGGWGDNFTSYWGDSIAGLGAMTGFYNPQTGEMVNSPGEWWDTARGAWGDAIHGFFPWTELGERPGYVFGTVLTNIGMIAGGAALSATGVGAVVGVPMIAARVSRILGGAGTGDGPISGGIDADGSEGSDGSSTTANNESSPTLRPDGTHPDAPTAPDSIEPDGSGVPAGLGDMHESLSDLEAHQNQGPQADPAPAPDNSPDPTPEPSTPPAEPAAPESNPPERPESDRDGAGSQDADTPGQRADEDVRRDPTTAEVDAAFSEIARRNEDLADDMDTADGGRMAELDGEAPWTIDALENSGSTGHGDGPGGSENSRVPVTPDGMEMHADGTVDNSADGDGPRLDEGSDPVTVHEDADPSAGDSSSGGPPRPPGPPGPSGPDRPEPVPDPEQEKALRKADSFEDALRNAGLTDEEINQFRGDNERDGRGWQRAAKAVLDNKFPDRKKLRLADIMMPEGIRFALDGTTSPFEFAYRYEYFKATFDQEALRIEAEIRSELGEGPSQVNIPNQAKTNAANIILNGEVNIAERLEFDRSTVREMRSESPRIETDPPDPEIADLTRSQAGEIGMGPESSAAYHARKHQLEIPTAERTGDPVRDYFNSAETTIREGELVNFTRLEDGGIHMTFERVVTPEPITPTPSGTREVQVMVAQVYLREHTGAVMSTYGSKTRIV
ncbi:hypothetical protein ACIRPH_28385 [Nocardiopsis sp. NPDC101807]|uniref:hypothetical protein n=1 Tax=Nocardiopsis sp. NPDC101807 TaxID=3364339 RepID=UPI0038251A25